MHARSALFDVFGDHLRTRGHRASVAGLVRLLDPLGVQAPAVRTAVSRMVQQGWLDPVLLPQGRGYRATEAAVARLTETHQRVYSRTPAPWDGTWHHVLLPSPMARSTRRALLRELTFLGYAPLAEGLWISPRQRGGLVATLERAGVRATTWSATDVQPVDAAVSAWDLADLGRAYTRWLEESRAELEGLDTRDDRAAYTARFRLVHGWRTFLFTDPHLPAELLPRHWAGHAAAEHFHAVAEELRPGSDRFLAAVLAEH